MRAASSWACGSCSTGSKWFVEHDALTAMVEVVVVVVVEVEVVVVVVVGAMVLSEMASRAIGAVTSADAEVAHPEATTAAATSNADLFFFTLLVFREFPAMSRHPGLTLLQAVVTLV